MRAVFATAVLLPLLRICEVKRPGVEVGAVGSIELMVAMTIAAIATFNLKKCPWHLVVFHHSSLFGSPFAKKIQGHNI